MVKHLFISAGHNYFGHHGRPAGDHPMIERPEVRCVAGRGIEGDRFFDYKEGYKGQVTFFAYETYRELCAALNVTDRSPAVFRRNIVTEELDLPALIGREFWLQGVHFRGMAECAPCYWMDQAFAPGAEDWLRGRGGLRARILTDGVLRAGG